MSIGSTMDNHRGVFIAITAIAALTLVVGCMPEKKNTGDPILSGSADTSAPTDTGGGGSTTTDTTGDGSSTATDTSGGGGSTTPADTSGGGGGPQPECKIFEDCTKKGIAPACKVWKCKANECKAEPTVALQGTDCKTAGCPKDCKCIKPPNKAILNCLPPKPPKKG